MMFSEPILEDDFYRYMWDGGVAAHGFNPYAFSPEAAKCGEAYSRFPIPSSLQELAGESEPVISRIRYSDIRTIYPLVAQGAFALAHWIRPWSLTAWRFVVLGFDVATLIVLIALLQTLGLPLWSSAIYWWNPLVVKELFNSSHMDGLALPLVLGAILLTIRGRALWAALSLAVATGAKLWPVLLLPLMVRPVLKEPRRLAASLAAFGLLTGALFVPAVLGRLDPSSGFVAYTREWEMNDGLFVFFLWGARFGLKSVGLNPGHAQLVARVVVLGLLAAWIARLAWREADDPADLCQRCLFAVAALFLLSPTQFPWYYVWLVPLLAIRPRACLLLYTALLPLYYLRFYFDNLGHVDVFDYGVVWVEHAPVCCLLIWEWWGGRRRAPLPEALA